MRALSIAVAAAAVIASPALAKADLTVVGPAEREYTEMVKIGDLNLANAADADALHSRVLAASGRVCASAHRENNSAGKLVGACTDGTYRDAKPQLERLIAMVESGKQLAATQIAVRLAMR